MSGRLLFVVEHFRWQGTGLEHSAVRLCRGLAARGFEVHVAAATGDSDADVTVHRELGQLDKLQIKLQPDLTIDWGLLHEADIHRLGAGTHEGYLDLYLDAFSGPARWWRKLERLSPRHQRVIRRQNRILSRSGARFIANSNLTAKLAIAGGAPSKNVEVCHQHVPLEQFNPEKARASRMPLREQWGLAKDDVAFLFVAHNLHLKNLQLLRGVFTRLENHRAKLVVVGKRQPRWSAPWMVHAGEVADMAAIYGAGDGLLHPTWFDSCANVVLEAMACELPVLVSDTSGIHELLPGEDVLSVRGASAQVEATWAGAVGALAAQPDLRALRGAAGCALAVGRGFDRFLDWFIDYLDTVQKAKR